MPRISDLGLQNILLANFQRAQGGAAERQTQLSSGKVSDRYSGIGPGTRALLSSEGVLARANAFSAATGAAASRLQIQESSMQALADSIGRLRGQLIETLATGGGELIAGGLAAEAQRVLASLNTESGGVYVFGGVDGASAPVAARSIADIIAAPDAVSLFQTTARSSLYIEDGVSVDGGPTAREIGVDVIEALRSLGVAPQSLGAFQGAPTAQQAQFITGMIAELDRISSAIYTEMGMNGLAQGAVAEAAQRTSQQRDLAEIVASEIEDVDIAEVVARLNLDRTAIEASARALAQASELSLLNYL
jgi:flagellar hook-associated protein 3 FlgL